MINQLTSDQQDKVKLQEEHHRKYLWTYYSLIVMGAWLMTGFFPMGYESDLMKANDIICGGLLIVLGFLSLNPTRYWAMWLAAFVGSWLCVAPLIFHAESASAYTTNTLMGILILVFLLVVPNIPGIMAVRKEGPNIPTGWSYNPSSWSERIPVVILGWLGFFTARYLAGFQLGYVDTIWDPFFGDGTRQILTSEVSKSFPVSDAGLGAVAYILDVIMGLAGRTARWRTMPWVVLVFGFLVIPLGIVSITLVILQPLSVGAWCSACLLSALITVGMIPFTFDEVVASIQFMNRKKKQEVSYWDTFWFGGTEEEGSVKAYILPGNKQFKSILEGMWEDLKIKPWNLFVSIIIGLWFMAAPGILGFNGSMADSNHFVGALIVTFSIISMSEVVRTGRFLNVLFALWIIASVWLFDSPGGIVMWTQLGVAAILIALSFRKGIIKDQHGGYDKYVK